jgi:hypothetical protein
MRLRGKDRPGLKGLVGQCDDGLLVYFVVNCLFSKRNYSLAHILKFHSSGA